MEARHVVTPGGFGGFGSKSPSNTVGRALLLWAQNHPATALMVSIETVGD
jgi:hypothetical protein